MKHLKKIGLIDGPDGPQLANYQQALRACGIEPHIITPSSYRSALPSMNGIVIPGGRDINPQRYGQCPAGTHSWSDAYDSYELDVIKHAVSLSLPILGICRGLQLLNVFFGGTLHQDIDADIHRPTQDGDSIHTTQAQGFVRDIYSHSNIIVNSAHHQAIDALGTGLHAVQWSEDTIIEAIEHEDLPIIATQWHPERMHPYPERICAASRNPHTADGQAVFQYFVNSANMSLG